MAEWFRHDADAWCDDKILMLRAKHGWEGYGLFWAIIERLRTSTNNRLANAKQVLELCLNVDKNKIGSLIDTCLELKLLEKVNEEIFSPALDSRMVEYNKMVKSNKKAGKLGGLARAKHMLSKRQASAKHSLSDLNRSDLNRIELKGVECKDPAPPPPNGIKSEIKDTDPVSPYLEQAKSKLCEPSGLLPWEKTNAFMSQGKQPMLKYPDIFLSQVELAEIMRQYTEAGIPGAKFREACQIVNGRVQTNKADGKSPDRINCFNWFIGWVKQELLESHTKERRLAKMEARP